MRVFLTGATGYIGSAIAEVLQKAGHQVTGLARSDESVRQLEARGIQPCRGDLLQPDAVAAAAHEADATIHTANTGDARAGEVDTAVVRSLLAALENTGKTFIYTSGVWVHGPTGQAVANEQSPLHPNPLVAHRPALEQQALNARSRGVRAIVIRPVVVYGRGGGLLAMLVRSARETGAARFVGDGNNRWPLVHVDDLAELYRLALEKAPAGALYIAADGPSISLRELATAASIGAGAKGKTQAWPLEEARNKLGAFADALAMDQQASGEKAKRELGWAPKSPSVLEDLSSGSYAH